MQPDRDHLVRIADRIADAPRGSRELDADLYEALGYEMKRGPILSCREMTWRYYEREGSRWLALGRVTTDLANAARKMPKEHAWAICFGNADDRGPHGASMIGPAGCLKGDDEPIAMAHTATVELAAAAAILRATAALLDAGLAGGS